MDDAFTRILRTDEELQPILEAGLTPPYTDPKLRDPSELKKLILKPRGLGVIVFRKRR